MSRAARIAARLALAWPAVLLCACGPAKQDMYDQPRYDPDEASPLFDDGRASRPPVPGTMAYASGDVAGTSSARIGAAQAEAERALDAAAAQPYPLTMDLLERGRERFTIYCEPCHSPLGDGDGRVVERGFPAPPSYHGERLRTAPDRHFYEVIRDGYGVMLPYGDRVPIADRWAIVAYIRALQRSQHVSVAALTPAQRRRLDGTSAADASDGSRASVGSDAGAPP